MRKLSIIIISCFLLIGCTKTSINTNNMVAPSTNSNNVSYYFARQTPNVDQQLIKVIDSSKAILDIAIYSLTKKSIVDAIIKAKDREVNVEIISDKIESSSKSEKAELALINAANIPVRINKHKGLMLSLVNIV